MGLLLGGWLTCGPARALGLQPLSQERYVEASTTYTDRLDLSCDEPGGNPCTDSASAQASAPGFGLFDATVEPTCAFLVCPAVSASQTSTITATRFRVSGSTVGHATFAHEGLQIGSSSSHARFEVLFRIDVATPYGITSFLTIEDRSAEVPYVFWTLQRVGTSEFIATADCPEFGAELPCNQLNVIDGILLPGDYRFILDARSDVYPALPLPNLGATTFDVDMRVPEPATALLLLPGLLALALRGGARRRAAQGPERQGLRGGRTCRPAVARGVRRGP